MPGVWAGGQARRAGPPHPEPARRLRPVRSRGHVVGRGHTQESGGPHAEVMALRDAAARGASVAGATVFVTLEPCSHHGRTRPCSDALVAAGVGRVVMAMPIRIRLVAGQGAARLAAAGSRDRLRPVRRRIARAQHRLRLPHGARPPWLRLKAAVSLDGRSALDNGVSQWITAEASRTDGHAWASAPARPSPASAPCSTTIRASTCASFPPPASRCA